MILTLRELADYLRVNERTIMRMLKSGQIKGAKIGGQWRFNGSQIDGLFFPESGSGEDEDVPLASLTRTHIGIPLSRVMSEERMFMDLKAQTAEDVIKELTPPGALGRHIMNIQELQERCMAREKLLSTGVGNGVAIPHPRDPLATLRAPAIVMFGRSKNGIKYRAADGKPVHLFFLLCCQNIELHLHLMGRLAQILRHDGFIQACMECTSATDVLRHVLEIERESFLN